MKTSKDRSKCLDSKEKPHNVMNEYDENLKDHLPNLHLHQYNRPTWEVEVDVMVAKLEQHPHHPRIKNSQGMEEEEEKLTKKIVMKSSSEDSAHQTRYLTKTRPFWKQDKTTCMP